MSAGAEFRSSAARSHVTQHEQASSDDLSAGMTLTRLLLEHRSVEAVRRQLAGGPLLALLDRHEAGAKQALAVLQLVDDPAEPGLQGCRRLFDAAAGVSGVAGVALYALDDEAMLAAATAEAVELLAALGVGRPGQRVLDVGCGIGRFEAALAGKVGSITGIDLSPEMIGLARQRCAGLDNVELRVCDGVDLGMFPDGAFDAVIAIDSFPFLYRAGGVKLAGRHVREAARVLDRAGGLVVLNLSYRGDLARDVEDARAFAAAVGLSLQRAGTTDLRTWDGRTFHFHKDSPSSGRSTAPQAYL
jgi:SAM-dependent methyltransferase